MSTHEHPRHDVDGYFAIGMRFVPPPEHGTAEDFSDLLERVLEELDTLGYEADMSATLASFQAWFLLPAGSRTPDELLRLLGDLRTALHAARVGTPDWPEPELIFRSLDGDDSDLTHA